MEPKRTPYTADLLLQSYVVKSENSNLLIGLSISRLFLAGWGPGIKLRSLGTFRGGPPVQTASPQQINRNSPLNILKP